ncbi:MAG: FecCD family ABC transporter permease [Alkaliphilus sp.]
MIDLDTQENRRKKTNWTTVLLILLPFVALFTALCLGRYIIHPNTVFRILFSNILPVEAIWTTIEESVVMRIRVPRVLLALLIGAGLSISGASFQGLFGNPLVSPHILGVAAGAGFGAALGILFSAGPLIIQVSALIFGVIAVLITHLISRIRKATPIFMLVLSGVVVGAFFQALISLLKYVADPEDTLPSIVFWLMGSFTGTSYRDLMIGAPLILIGIVVLLLLRWRINILSLGAEEAKALGINVERTKWAVILMATLITAVSVSLSGIVGWVGLIIPHIGRMLVGNNHRKLLPSCVSIGAVYMLFIDTIARTATAAEIPLSILTAVIGAPVFAYLLRRTGGKWE